MVRCEDGLRVFVEGGGDNSLTRGRCKQAFCTLIQRAGFADRMPKFTACGSRQRAFEMFAGDADTRLLPELARVLMDEHRIFTVAIDQVGVRGVRVTPNVCTSSAELDQLVAALRACALSSAS